MDRVYDFSWMVKDIDSSIIFMVYDKANDGKPIGFQIGEVLTTDMEKPNVKFANINDLMNFVLNGIARFVDCRNNHNIVDIPVRNLYLLYDNSNRLDEDKDITRVKLNDLGAFSVLNGNHSNGDYQIEAINFQKCSKELFKVMVIAYNFTQMGMYDRVNALAELNLLNYQKHKSDSETVISGVSRK